jgi:hypothetical protein
VGPCSQKNQLKQTVAKTGKQVMQSEFVNITSRELEEVSSTESETAVKEPIWFRTHFVGCMEMYASTETVAEYLNAHQGWFRRCAHPMQADPLGENGYALTIGRFGALGYEVEPKIGLDLTPQEAGVYRIATIPVPNYTPPGYEVDFQARQVLVEIPIEELSNPETGYFQSQITRVEWHLNLNVGVLFPKFIHALPKKIIEKTGDRLLAQIVKQISRRLTYKVQEDFHNTLGLSTLDLFHKNRANKTTKTVCEQVFQ